MWSTKTWISSCFSVRSVSCPSYNPVHKRWSNWYHGCPIDFLITIAFLLWTYWNLWWYFNSAGWNLWNIWSFKKYINHHQPIGVNTQSNGGTVRNSEINLPTTKHPKMCYCTWCCLTPSGSKVQNIHQAISNNYCTISRPWTHLDKSVLNSCPNATGSQTCWSGTVRRVHSSMHKRGPAKSDGCVNDAPVWISRCNSQVVVVTWSNHDNNKNSCDSNPKSI